MKPFYLNVASTYGHILHTFIDENGKRVREKVNFYPKVFLDAKPGAQTIYKNIHGNPVSVLTPGNILETREFIDKYKDADNFKIYHLGNYPMEFISENYDSETSLNWNIDRVNITLLDIETDSSNGFPKPEEAKEPILAITMKNNQGLFVSFSTKDFDSSKVVHPDFKYIKCLDEEDLLKKFIHCWTQNYPDVISGWNVKGFDITYICNRILNLFDEKTLKTLSPWGIIKTDKELYYGKEIQNYKIIGMTILDYLQLYRKYGPPNSRESYKLDFIAELELKEKKKDYSQYKTLNEFYEEDFQGYIEYNIQDVLLIEKLEEKLNLINLALVLSYDCLVNYEDILFQTRMWDSLCYNNLMAKNIVTEPRKGKESRGEKFEGAYVKDPVVGKHKWVVSLDATSLYPSIERMFNISPDTIVKYKDLPAEVKKLKTEKLNKSKNLIDDLLSLSAIDLSILKKYNLCMTANGVFFSTEKQGFLPEILEKMAQDRDVYKKKFIDSKKKVEELRDNAKKNGGGNEQEIYDGEKIQNKFNLLQNAKKVGGNSSFGALGNEGFRYYDLDQAEGITLSGQFMIKFVAKICQEYLISSFKLDSNREYIVYIDTDSLFIDFNDVVEKYKKSTGKTDDKEIRDFLINFVQKKLQPHLETEIQKVKEYLNCSTNKIFMKLEKISNVAIWTAKKRYALNMLYDEGVYYDTPKLKVVGLSLVKSDTPKVCRLALKKALDIIINKTNKELTDFIERFRDRFNDFTGTEIGISKSVNNLDKYACPVNIFVKGTPLNSKGSLIYNYYLKQYKITNKYPLIQEGDKIKYVYLKTPNLFEADSICFLTKLPEEFRLKSEIDYDTMFDKSFLSPLEEITGVIGWTIKNHNSLMGN